jgi:hypothetical protein
MVTAAVVLLGAASVLSFLLGWLGAGFTENFGVMWLLFGVGVAALVAAALLSRSTHSRITLTKHFRR